MFRAAQLKQLDDSYNLLKVMFLDTTLFLILFYAKIHLLSVRTAAFAARYYMNSSIPGPHTGLSVEPFPFQSPWFGEHHAVSGVSYSPILTPCRSVALSITLYRKTSTDFIGHQIQPFTGSPDSWPATTPDFHCGAKQGLHQQADSAVPLIPQD